MTNTHILVQTFDYLEPTTLREAIALLEEYGERARVLAGGTDLLVHMKMERLAPRYLVSLRRVPGLSGIEVRDDHVWVGALTSIRAIRNDPRIQARYPALAEACASFSTTQVQVMGTIGGNLGNGYAYLANRYRNGFDPVGLENNGKCKCGESYAVFAGYRARIPSPGILSDIRRSLRSAGA